MQRHIGNEVFDARASTFYMIAQIVRSIKIYFILKNKYLNDRQWYVDTYLLEYGQQWPVTGGRIAQVINDHDVLRDFNQVIIIGYTQILFSIVESRFRLFAAAIDPTVCSRGIDGFYDLSTWLLSELGKTKEYERFVRFFALIRNTIHNNGIYTDRKRPAVPIEYRGKT